MQQQVIVAILDLAAHGDDVILQEVLYLCFGHLSPEVHLLSFDDLHLAIQQELIILDEGLDQLELLIPLPLLKMLTRNLCKQVAALPLVEVLRSDGIVLRLVGDGPRHLVVVLKRIKDLKTPIVA